MNEGPLCWNLDDHCRSAVLNESHSRDNLRVLRRPSRTGPVEAGEARETVVRMISEQVL